MLFCQSDDHPYREGGGGLQRGRVGYAKTSKHEKHLEKYLEEKMKASTSIGPFRLLHFTLLVKRRQGC